MINFITEWPGPPHDAYPPVELPMRISGTVIDTGGGQINVLIDSDTAEYPIVGSRVYMEIRNW